MAQWLRLMLWVALLATAGQGAAQQPPKALPVPAQERQALLFDPALFQDYGISPQLLAQFNAHVAQEVAPGMYRLDVYLNGIWRARRDMEIRAMSDGHVGVCMKKELLTQLGLEPRGQPDQPCPDIGELFEHATAAIDISRLRLDVSMPQSFLHTPARGSVERADLDAGITALSLNYIANYQYVNLQSAGGGGAHSAFLSLDAGLNALGWQMRQQSSMNYTSATGFTARSLRGYVQRPLLEWDSQLSAGQLFTTGRLFSGMSYSGVHLRTDDRMLPESLRGYAPVIRGMAQTNAKVTIRQNGFEIYQTPVAPGAFEIRDLYPTSYNGDLQVEIAESDGRVRSFTVAFSAVPESLREGATRYDLALGKTRNQGDNAFFGDLTYSQGLTSSVTGNAGLRLSSGYRSMLLGAVMNTRLGALGMDFRHSYAQVHGSEDASGWMAHLSFSRTFADTGTAVALAGYKYSTAGYRELSDVLALRSADGGQWRSTSYLQKQRFDVSINQSLGETASVYLTASRGSYRSLRESDKQLQLGISKTFRNGMSMNLSVARQQMGMGAGAGINGMGPVPFSPQGKERVAMLSLSLPLDALFRSAGSDGSPGSLSTSVTHSSLSGSSRDATYSSVSKEVPDLSYSVSASSGQSGRSRTLSATAQKRLGYSTVAASASRGKGFWQAGLSTQGALVLHAGGATFGPYLGETYALIEAPGAQGASVFGGQSARVNKHGFALVPSVTPYRYNSIALDAQDMSGDYELLTSERRVAPVAGAAVKLTYETRGGAALLIKLQRPGGQAIPMGAEVLDPSGELLGMVGQGNQIYLRTQLERAALRARWGDGAANQCAFELNTANAKQSSAPAVAGQLKLLKADCR